MRLRGELSGVKRAASGHFYCALKDEGAVIDGVMWKGNAGRPELPRRGWAGGDRHRQADHLSGPVEIPDRDRQP